MSQNKNKETLKLIAINATGQLSEQDNYLSLDDLYVMRTDDVSAKTWSFILKSEVDLRTLEYVNPVHNLLKNYFINLSAKQYEAQVEALSLWLEVFGRTDFLGQNKLWNLMEDTLADEFKHLKNDTKKLILKTLLKAIPLCLTHNLRGECLVWLLPGENYAGFISAETPRAIDKLFAYAKLFSRKQLYLLMSFAEDQGLLRSRSKKEFRELKWQLYFGPVVPVSAHDKLALLQEARKHENSADPLVPEDIDNMWQVLGDESIESVAAIIEYLRKDLARSVDSSSAVLGLMQVFCRKGLSSAQKMHVLEALMTRRTFSDPLNEESYKASDYLAVIELFNARPLDRTIIMTYFYEHKEQFEELKAYINAELEAAQDNPSPLFIEPYEEFQAKYRDWFVGSGKQKVKKN